MPADNIERAIKKGVGGGEGANFEDLTYEVYGPHGVALLVEVSTDNRNRTASDVRSIVTKSGGSIATPGSVSRLFHRKGQIIVSRENAGEDKLMELALEAGAEDFKTDAEGFEILTEPANFEAVHKKIESAGIKCEAAGITSLPGHHRAVERRATVAAVNKLIDALEDHDDVKEVYSNAEFPDAEWTMKASPLILFRADCCTGWPWRSSGVPAGFFGPKLSWHWFVSLSRSGFSSSTRTKTIWSLTTSSISRIFSASKRNFPNRATTCRWSSKATTRKRTGNLSSASPPK